MENICRICGCRTIGTGHLCDPKKVSKRVYICAGCGIITTEKELLCRPGVLKLK